MSAHQRYDILCAADGRPWFRGVSLSEAAAIAQLDPYELAHFVEDQGHVSTDDFVVVSTRRRDDVRPPNATERRSGK
jgi:hypothetical protein